MTINRIITRGLGASRGKPGRAGLITQGYGGPIFTAILESARVTVLHGRSATKRVIEEIVITAKLVRVNGIRPKENVQGSVRVLLEAFKKSAKIIISEVKATVKDVVQIFVSLKKKK
jgi:hypothetical protein